MNSNFHISIVLDKRRAKSNGKYPVKLRVFTSTPRKQKLLPTDFEFTAEEYNELMTAEKPRKDKKEILLSLREIETKAIQTAKELNPFTIERFEKKLYLTKSESTNIVYHYQNTIKALEANNQFGTANNYKLSIKSIIEYCEYRKGRKPKEISFHDVSIDFLNGYEKYMTEVKGNSETTVSMYLRTLRTIFNKAINENEISENIYPFGGKYGYKLPNSANIKKSLSKSELKQLYTLKPFTKEQEMAKDFWFFSYNCNGMNIKDIAMLRYKNIDGNNLNFKRAKTKKTAKNETANVSLPLNDYAIKIIEKYGDKDKRPNSFIFPIISEHLTEYEKFRKIKNFIRFINQNIDKMYKDNGIDKHISTYFARHSFATNAIVSGASMEYVSEALGHSNFKTTKNYFKGFPDEKKKEIQNTLMDFVENETK